MAQIGKEGTGTRVSIPDLTSPANIQDAFKTYHLGVGGTDEAPAAISLAASINALQADINSKESTARIELTNDDQSLNGLVNTNNYYRLSAPKEGMGYPILAGTSNTSGPGYLSVYNIADPLSETKPKYVFQTYLMILPGGTGIDTTQRTALFYRSNVGTSTNTWTPWVQTATAASIIAAGGKQDSIALGSTQGNKVLITNSGGSLVNSADSVADVTKLEIESLKGILSLTPSLVTSSVSYKLSQKADLGLKNILLPSETLDKAPVRQALGGTIYTNVSGSNGNAVGGRIFVQPTQPTGAVNGDLWFWGV